MINCSIDKGLTALQCSFNPSGISKVFIANFEDVASYELSGTDGLINSIVMESGKVFYEFSIPPNTNSFTNEEQVSGSQKWINQTVNVIVKNDDQNAVAVGMQLGLGKFVAVMVKKDGKKYIFGRNVGLEATALTFSSGTAAGDQSGLTFTLTAEEVEISPLLIDAVPTV